MIGRRSQSAFRDPILLGALTVLVTVIAVYLAYNANNGLPFVPTYDVNATLPDASGLIASDSVLIGGTRVGYVSGVTATTLPNGQVAAVAHLKLAKSIEPLPADSTDLVRPVSPLGLQYLEINRGRSSSFLTPGSTIPLSHTHLPVQIDDVLKMFNQPTRTASQSNLNEFGDGFAGRGADLNRALGELKPLTYHLLPVMTNLIDPRTRWAQLFPSLEQSAGEVVGVADSEARLFVSLNQTFTPLSAATPALQASIAGGPPALETATRELPAQAPFINDTAKLFHDLHPAFVDLGTASEQLSPAISAGIPALRRTPQLNGRLDSTLAALQRFVIDSRTLPGLVLLTDTAALLEPTLAFLTPAQTRCNYFALFFRNLESAVSESDSVGSFLRIGILALPQLPNSEAGPSSAPADGPPAPSGIPLTQASLVDDSFLHSNPYPNTDAPGQTPECEAGNEVYTPRRQVIGNDPGDQGLVTEVTKRTLP